MRSMVDLLSLPLPEAKKVLGHRVEVEVEMWARTKYVVGTLALVTVDGLIVVASDDGLVVRLAWNEVKAAFVDVEKDAG